MERIQLVADAISVDAETRIVIRPTVMRFFNLSFEEISTKDMC